MIVALLLAVAWPGPAGAATTWTIQPVPLPAGGANGGLDSVSCTGARSCMAVGSDSLRRGQALAVHWNGSTWTSKYLANAHTITLNAVSCAAADSCTAVGYGPGEQALAEYWNGSRWAVQPTPTPAGSASELEAVSCPAADSCTATGFIEDPGGPLALADHWNGSTWTIQPTPAPAGESEVWLNGVSCASADSCTAVGKAANAGQGASLAEYWNGSTWAIQPVPVPVGAEDSGLAGVSCASADSCFAVGGYDNSSYNSLPLTEQWNGSTWTVQPVPLSSKATGFLGGISCVSADSCTADGWDGPATAYGTALAVYWHGSTWIRQATARPASLKNFYAVSCVYARTCTAVGYSVNTGGSGQGQLVEREQ
ncbi:MAG: hypothetical protein ACRDNF_16920 [Streptosporangiaceae bacterium]